MLRAMYSGISGMKVNQTKLDVIGNNIANVSTTAFKSATANFKDSLYQNASSATAPTTTKGGTNANQIGLGAQLSSINTLMSQGNALSTARSLDVCIDGEGYIVVASGKVDYATAGVTLNNEQGISDSDMSINYTRDGNLSLDYQGNLVTSDGHRVMGYLLSDYSNAKPSSSLATEDGKPEASVSKGDAIFVDADSDLKASNDRQLQPLKIPDQVYVPADTTTTPATEASWQKVASFSIGKDGIITAILGNGSRAALGQIATATFKNPEGLTSVGGNLYEVSSNSGSEVIRTSINIDKTIGTSNANADVSDNSNGFGDMLQGYLEASNVDLTEQFTGMITATRAFQASSKMITTSDEILQTITNLM